MYVDDQFSRRALSATAIAPAMREAPRNDGDREETATSTMQQNMVIDKKKAPGICDVAFDGWAESVVVSLTAPSFSIATPNGDSVKDVFQTAHPTNVRAIIGASNVPPQPNMTPKIDPLLPSTENSDVNPVSRNT